ncbi:tetratricopeptide repeat protein [Candidatus Poribacteria bacterium]|nr:tetratricopeptide repeat protein [Candidatus Poribacteria bacterium]
MSSEDLTDLKNGNSIVRVETKRIASFGLAGACSGFFVEPDKVVTNIHGITERKPILVRSVDGKTTWKVKGVAAFDAKNDLVILQVVGEGTPLPLVNSDDVQNGEPITVVGFPYAEYKVTEGSVQDHQYSDERIRMKADISYGNSGSPILNEKGQVIGIASYASNDSYAWAVTSNLIKTLIERVEPAEPLRTWRNRKIIRSYTFYLQGKRNDLKKRFRKAIVDYDKALKLNPKLTEAYEDRGVVKDELSDFEGSISDYDSAIRLNPEKASLYNNRGLAKSELGDVEGAIADYDKSIELKPNDTDAYNNRGLAKSELGDKKGAISDYDKAIKINPNEADFYSNRGIAMEDLGNYAEAIVDYDKAIKLNPKYAGFYNNRGVAKSWLGDVEGAIADYEKAIKLNPQDTSPYRNRVILRTNLAHSESAKGNLKRAENLYQAAIEDCTAAIKIDPEQVENYYSRGDIQFKVGILKEEQGNAAEAQQRYEKSIEDYSQVIKRNPEHSRAYFDRGLAKEALGQQDAAKADFQKAKELDPDVEKSRLEL